MHGLEEGREWELPGLLYTDELVLCGESEENLRAMLGRFVEVCKKRGLKVNADKSKVMVMNGEKGLQCEVHVDGIVWSMSLNSNIWGVFWTKQVPIEQNVVGR